MIEIWYDRAGDFSEVVFEQVPVTMEELEEDVSLRRTPDGRVVGFAVMNFSKHNLDGLRVPLEVKARPTALAVHPNGPAVRIYT